MICKSCKEIIPSKFAHAIKTNICPFCGEEIMDSELQSVLSELQSVMKNAEPYMEAVEEWLSSNYSLKKVVKGSHSSSTLSPIKEGEDESFDEESIRRQTEAAKNTTDFQKRAGIKAHSGGMSAKELIAQIKGGSGAADPSEFVGEDPDYGHVDFSNEVPSAPLSQKDALQMISALGGEEQVQDSDDVLKNYYDMQKLKRLQSSGATGGGKFSRGG